MKNKIVFQVLLSVFVGTVAYADPVTAVQNIGNYMLSIAIAGIPISLGLAALHFKFNDHTKAWRCVKGAVLALMCSVGAPGIITLLKTLVR